MREFLEISLLGEVRVREGGREVALPASRKARALLGFLAATGRPHRRERLCELFWDLPDDPKAALRWGLTKLRQVVDTGGHIRIRADRERVALDDADVRTDLGTIYGALRRNDATIAPAQLAEMADRLDQTLLDGLDGAGSEAFDAWLLAEREDARVARVAVLKRLATAPGIEPLAARKWLRLWREADPEGAAVYGSVPRAAEKVAVPSSLLSKSPAASPQPARPASRAASSSHAQSRALRAQRIGFCDVPDGIKIAYASVGAGPPLLKAANWLNHLEFDWASPIWGRSFAEIARHRTFIRYDERGCGLSDWDVEDLSFNAFVEDLEVVADKLGLERFPLLGISQGCAVSIEYAVRHPERVSGLILISGYAAGWRISTSPEEQERRKAVLKLTELGWGTDNPAYRHIFSQTFMPDASAADLEWFDDFQRQTTSPHNAARFQDAFGYIDVRDRLAEVQAPTIVLHARDDQRIPLSQGRVLASGIPDAHFVPLDSRNHILVDREPAWRDAVAAIRRFIAEKGI